jgi:hypothetical protein
VGRVHPPARDAGGEGDGRRAPRSACSSRRPSSGSRRRASSIARRRPTRRCSAIDPNHLGAAEALIPIYEQANNPKGLAGAIEVKLSHDVRGRREALELLREVAGLYETKLKEPSSRSSGTSRPSSSLPSDEQCDRGRGARGAASRVAGTRSSPPTTAAITRAAEAAITPSRSTLHLRLGRVLVDEVKRPRRRALAVPRGVRARRENAEAIGALERLYRETGRTRSCSASTRRSATSREPEERKQILYPSPSCTRSEIGPASGHRHVRVRSSKRTPMDARRARRARRLYRAQSDWEPYVDVLRKRIELEAPRRR